MLNTDASGTVISWAHITGNMMLVFWEGCLGNLGNAIRDRLGSAHSGSWYIAEMSSSQTRQGFHVLEHQAPSGLSATNTVACNFRRGIVLFPGAVDHYLLIDKQENLYCLGYSCLVKHTLAFVRLGPCRSCSFTGVPLDYGIGWNPGGGRYSWEF